MNVDSDPVPRSRLGQLQEHRSPRPLRYDRRSMECSIYGLFSRTIAERRAPECDRAVHVLHVDHHGRHVEYTDAGAARRDATRAQRTHPPRWLAGRVPGSPERLEPGSGDQTRRRVRVEVLVPPRTRRSPAWCPVGQDHPA